MYMNAFPLWMCVYHMHTWCLRKSKEGVRSFEAAVTDGFEPSQCKSRLCGASFSSFSVTSMFIYACSVLFPYRPPFLA